MNNINALLFSTSVIGMPIQQGQLKINSFINFQDIINNLIKKENDNEISNILNQINSNPEIIKSIYEAITALNLYGQLNEVAKSNTDKIESNQIINYILNNNNLSSEEKQIVINSIKIISQQIVKEYSVIANNSENYEKINQQNIVNQQTGSFKMCENTKSNDFNNTVLPPNIAENIVIQTPDNNLKQNQNKQTIQILFTQNNLSNINNNLINNRTDIITGDKSVISTRISQEQKIDNADNNLKINIPDTNIKLENLVKIKNQISDILNLLSNITIDNNQKTLQDEISNLNNYVLKLDNIISQINITNTQDSEQLKNISIETSKLINSIFISLINITAGIYNNYIYYNKGEQQQDIVSPIGNDIKDNNYINENLSQNNRQIYVSENENNNLLKQLIGKIFVMLKEMNGELYIGKKIEYVYKPFSNQSSQVTPDGILLLNTADIKNFKKFNINLQQIINSKTPIEINNISNTLNISSENATIINDKINNIFNTMNGFVYNSISNTHSYDIPKTFQLTKDNINQSIINTTNRNNNTNLKEILDEINTYFVNFIENKAEQKTINLKTFEQIIDFSGKVKDDIVIKQIVKNIADAIKYKTSEKIEVKMMLRPENLGPVIIKFESKDNVINGRIDVATTMARDILKTNIIELKNTLNNMGYNIENFEISMLNAYTSTNSNTNPDYYNGQKQNLPIYINNEIIEDIGVITGTDSYLNYLA